MTLARALWASTKNTAGAIVYYTARNLADWLETLSQDDDWEPVGERHGTAWVARRDT